MFELLLGKVGMETIVEWFEGDLAKKLICSHSVTPYTPRILGNASLEKFLRAVHPNSYLL